MIVGSRILFLGRGGNLMTSTQRHTEADYRDSPLYGFAVRSKLYRPFTIFRGLYRTYVARSDAAYEPASWWDRYYTGQPIEDATTLNPGKELYPSLYHYNSIENLILSYLFNTGAAVDGAHVLDVGSGAGHWLGFYAGLGAASVTGVELSHPAAEALSERFADNTRINVIQGNVAEREFDRHFDLVNAIGVMFHIVDDEAFDRTVTALVAATAPGGLLVFGGHFGIFDNVNVQYDREGRVNKRLRSRRHWRRLLTGCRHVDFVRNDAYRHIDATLPENNLLIARR
ncbi:MAG: class I SAM-dependent methyltransferase [Inquilinus sp.]|nr:class I SAM-dependent methyltransferase [Inquilinus sp.]